MCQANKSTLTLRTFNELSPSSQPLVRVAALGNRNIAERAAFFNDDGLPRHCYPHARPQRRTQLHRDGPRSVSASPVTTREMPAQCAAVSHIGQGRVVDTSTQPERSRVHGRRTASLMASSVCAAGSLEETTRPAASPPTIPCRAAPQRHTLGRRRTAPDRAAPAPGVPTSRNRGTHRQARRGRSQGVVKAALATVARRHRVQARPALRRQAAGRTCAAGAPRRSPGPVRGSRSN